MRERKRERKREGESWHANSNQRSSSTWRKITHRGSLEADKARDERANAKEAWHRGTRLPQPVKVPSSTTRPLPGQQRKLGGGPIGVPPLASPIESVSRAGRAPSGLDPNLETRFEKLKRRSRDENTWKVLSTPVDSTDSSDQLHSKQVKTKRKVSWADNYGDPLCTYCSAPGSVEHQDRPLQPVKESSRDSRNPEQDRPKTYKEALLRNVFSARDPQYPRRRRAGRLHDSRSRKIRCFRCLAGDHLIRDCRDPLRCTTCRRTGHRARQCPLGGSSTKTNMQRARDFRPQVIKVFIPLTEDFYNR